MDYTKFKDLGEEETEAERKAREEDAKRALETVEAARKAAAGDASSSDSEDSDDDLSPLFWTKPPSARKKASEKALAMEKLLDSMVYGERTPEEIADSFKERGNVAYQQNNLKDAISLYSEALSWAHKAWTAEKDMSPMISSILSNRAAVELKRQNFRSTIREAQASLRASPNGPSANKARYRGAKACLELKKPQEALDKFLDGADAIIRDEEKSLAVVRTEETDEAAETRRKRIIAEHAELRSLLVQAHAMQKKLAADERARMKLMVEEKKEDQLWRERLAKRGFSIGPLAMDIKSLAGAKPSSALLYPVISEETGAEWAWPCLFMYPEHAQSDFVQALSESTTLEQILSTMFPPGIPAPAPWDPAQHYTVPNLECYFRERAAVPFDLTRPLASQVNRLTEELENDVATRRWFRVPLAMTLRQILGLKTYAIPGVPLFVVLSKHKDNKYRSIFLESCRSKDGPVVDVK